MYSVTRFWLPAPDDGAGETALLSPRVRNGATVGMLLSWLPTADCVTLVAFGGTAANGMQIM